MWSDFIQLRMIYTIGVGLYTFVGIYTFEGPTRMTVGIVFTDMVHRYFSWDCKPPDSVISECRDSECADDSGELHYFYNGRDPRGKHLHRETIRSV